MGTPKEANVTLDQNLHPYVYRTPCPGHLFDKFPHLSPTITVGTIVKWKKKVGDQVFEGDLLCETETSKGTMDIETPGKGFLAKTLYEDGETNIPVTKPIDAIAKEKEDIEDIKK